MGFGKEKKEKNWKYCEYFKNNQFGCVMFEEFILWGVFFD